MKPLIRTLLCLAAAVAAFAAAVFFIVTAAVADAPPATAVHAVVPAPSPTVTPATLVVRVQAAPQVQRVRGVLLRGPDRVPAEAGDRVYDLTPTLSNGGADRPLTWRALLTDPQAVHHA